MNLDSLRRSSRRERRATCVALASLSVPPEVARDAIAALIEVLARDDDALVRLAAVHTLEVIGARIHGALEIERRVPGKMHGEATCIAAARVVGVGVFDGGHLEAVASALAERARQDRDSFVRGAALASMGAVARGTIARATMLVGGLASSDRHVRAGALRGLVRQSRRVLSV